MVKNNHQNAFPAAKAVEYLHNFTLMHDDIMDKAESRRGKASVHAKWDESVAILSGDVMFTMAMQLLMERFKQADFEPSYGPLLCNSFLSATRYVCEGQAYDMLLPIQEKATTEDYLSMIEGKTAALLGASMELGALCVHATPKQAEQLKAIGIKAGMAFQLQDDILDVFGETEKTGKKAAGDIYERKKTLLFLHAVAHASQEESTFLTQLYATENTIELNEVERVKEVMTKSGAKQYCMQKMTTFYKEAHELLTLFPESTYKNALTNLLDLLWHRDH
jgi:geranylgeranyl diphosphate synthase type II